MTEYSYCESVSATPWSPRCIRPLTKAGRKLGGGIDTPSLCGRVKPPGGWDLAVRVDNRMTGVCGRCQRKWREAMAREIDEG